VTSSVSGPLTWRNDFGPVSPTDSVVTLTLTLDLSTDIPETTGPEVLGSWRVDSLKWNPAVLQYVDCDFGQEGAGSVNPTDAVAHGKLLLNGVQSIYGSTGVVALAYVRFKVIGGSGQATTTTTTLGAVRGTAGSGFFEYLPFTSILEATLQAP
jgi:hypothetical protein